MRGTTRTPMKIMLRVLALAGVLAVVGVIVLALSLTTLIKTGVETMGARMLGVPVTLEDVDISLPSGGTSIQASLKQLTIGNPKGYETEHALAFPYVLVRVDWRSLLSDTVIVEEVLIAEPSITFERLRLGSNLADIRRNVERNVRSDSDDEDDDEHEERHEEEEESEPRVHIKHVAMKDAEINVSLLGGQSGVVRLPLPDIELRDIGNPSEGAGLRESSARIFDAVYDAVINAVAQSGTIIPKEIKQLGKSAAELGKTVEEAGKKLLKGLF